MGLHLASGSVVRRALSVAMLITLFVSGALLVIWVTLRGRTVSVPEVVRLSEAAAQDELESAGLVMQISGRSHHETVPAQFVCDQSPPAGATVKTGQLVRVTLSLGAAPANEQSAPH